MNVGEEYLGSAGNPGGDLLGDGEPLDDGLGEGVDGGVAAAAGLDGVVGAAVAGLDGVVAADEAAGDRAPDEVQLSSSPRSWAAILALATHSVSKFFSKPFTTRALT